MLRSVDGSYRTLFGPCVAHNGVIYKNSDNNVSQAFASRMTAVRLPEKPGMHQQLFANQASFIEKYTEIVQLLIEQCRYLPEEFFSIEEEAEEHHDDTHPKKRLRIEGWRDLNESGERFQRLWLRSVLYKMKTDEIAKWLKPARMIGDLGVAASLQGFMITKHLKQLQAENPIEVNGGTLNFCVTPSYQGLKNVFKNLIHPKEKYYFVYFSDDSCFSFRHRGKTYMYNLDISKCDGSHGNSLFELLITITPPEHKDDMKKLIEQLSLPVRVSSTGDKSKFVLLTFDGPRLFSGSTLTTFVNNVANILIGYALSRAVKSLLDREYSIEELTKIFTEACYSCGYIVTGFKDDEICKTVEDLQFLKHSPVQDLLQEYQPVLNLGVMFRSSGTCKGDLPGSKNETIESRARKFQYSILHGMYPRTHIPFLERMKDRTGRIQCKKCDSMVGKDLEFKVDHVDEEHSRIFSDECALRRYKLTPLEVAELLEFSDAGVYQHTSSSFVTKVLTKDYGLSALEW